MASSIRAPRRLLLTTVLICALVALTACSPGMPTEPPGITGSVTTIEDVTDPQGARSLRILVEGENQPPGAVSDKAYVTVTEKTLVFGPGDEPASMDLIEPGLTFEVWFDGAVAESYPVQGSASVVRWRP